MNENYKHPQMPDGIEDDIIRGMYCFKKSSDSCVQLLGSGAILLEVIKAADVLESEFKIKSTIWSVTSFVELRRDIDSCERHNKFKLDSPVQKSHVEKCICDSKGPCIAASDYVRAFADQIRFAINNLNKKYYVLGTDGFGRSDTREALRDFFEVDYRHIAYTAMVALFREDKLSLHFVKSAALKLNIDSSRVDPFYV